MKFLFVSVFFSFLASCSHNTPSTNLVKRPTPPEAGIPIDRAVASERTSKYLTKEFMGIIDLSGVVIENAERGDQVGTSVRLVKPNKGILEKLMIESGDAQLVSRVFAAVKKGKPTTYVFITQKETNKPLYRINVLNHFMSGSMSLIDYDIIASTNTEMVVVNSAGGEESFRVKAERTFFPNVIK
ncbi:MAG: hypothetical protein K2Q18_12040 [Bdellovibrionales bacterium]|nr:hypothetical protein [Bdellovibrionales bacterium]